MSGGVRRWTGDVVGDRCVFEPRPEAGQLRALFDEDLQARGVLLEHGLLRVDRQFAWIASQGLAVAKSKEEAADLRACVGSRVGQHDVRLVPGKLRGWDR